MSSMSPLTDKLVLLIRRPKHETALKQAVTWPLIMAKTLASKVVPKDPLAEEGSTFQTFQIETAFYFTLPGESGGYFGGHLRSQPMSDSEAHRMIAQLAEDTPVNVRYNPAHPDDNHTLTADNPNALPFPIWSY
jgi:hypothetical protein